MKNPLAKQNNSSMIAAILIGSIAAGTIAYLYLTESGDHLLGDMKKKFKETAKDVASGAISNKTGISKKLIKKLADHVVK